MQGWKILRHSWMQVSGNRHQILKLMAVPFGIQIVFGILMGGSMGVYSDTPWFVGFGSGRVILIAVIFIVLTSIWVAVGWHRLILLPEAPDRYFSYPNGTRVNEYFWRMILLMLGLVLIAGIGWMGLLLAAEFAGFGTDPTVRNVIIVLPALLVVYLFLRISPVLTSIAVGVRIPVREAWGATKNSSGAMFVIVGVIGAYQLTVETLIFPVAGSNLVASVLYDITTSWIDMIIWITLMTTIYGHYVEGRKLF